MKKIYYYLLLVNILSINYIFSQGSSCANTDAFCAGGSALTFQNSTGTTSESGINYECLGSQPNPAWFYMQIGTAGPINFQINQATNSGNPIDVDYILWGPFPGPIDTTLPFPYCGSTYLNPASSVSCSFSAAAQESFTIANAQVGQIYVVLLTNYSGQAGNITVTQTNTGTAGAGATDCNIVCPLSVDDQVICQGNQAILTATIAGATTYQWSSSVSGPIPGNTQSIIVTQPATYTVIVNKPGCVANATASATVSYHTPPPTNPPANLSQCSNLPNFDLTQNLATIFNGTGLNPADFEVYFHHTAADAQNVANAINNAAAYPGTCGEVIYMSITDNSASSSGCVTVVSFTLSCTVCVATPVTPPNLVVCDDPSNDGSASFDFTPQTAIALGTHSASDYTITYHLSQAAADGDTGAISPITGFIGTNGQTIYIRMEENANPLTYGTTSFQLIVNPLPTASISGTTTICSGNSTLISFTGTPNAVVTYTVGGNPAPTVTLDAAGAGSVSTGVLTTTTVYALVSVLNPTTNCSQTQSGSATVTVKSLPTASISGTTAVCQNGVSPQVTFTGANGTAPYTFTYSINSVVQPAITTIVGNSISVTASSATPGSFVYTLISVQSSGVPACSQNQSGSATITVNPLPTATISGSTATCLNAPSPQLILTGSNGTAPYTFTYSINSVVQPTVQSTGGNTAILTVPTTTAGTFTYDLISVQDASSTACSQLQSGSAVVTVSTPPTINTPTPFVVCDDTLNNDGLYCFDLTTKNPEISVNPNVIITYHETVTDSQTGANPLPNPYCNILPGLQTVYVRAVDFSAPLCYSTTTLQLQINPLPVVSPVPDYELCDYNNPGDGVEVFTLNSKDTEVANGQPGVTISYYDNPTDAANQTNALPNLYPNTSNPQQIWTNIENSVTGCNSVGTFNLVVNPLPMVTVPPTIFQCSNGASTQAQFDLTINEGVVTGGVTGLIVTYYNTLADAQNETSPIATPLDYTGTDNEIVYIRVENTTTGCYATTTQLLRVTQGPATNTPIALHYCDPNNDGFGVFDLTLATNQIAGVGGTVPSGVSVSYYETQTDALIGASPSLTSPYFNIIPNIQTIYVRVYYTLTGCANYEQLQLIVDPTPVVLPPSDYVKCDYTGAVGYETFDLTTKIPEVLGSLDPTLNTVTFYTNFSDAQLGTNNITNVTNYVNATPGSQTIYVRVTTNATGCYTIVDFDLIVNGLPNATLPNYPRYSLCDYTGAVGYETFDLASQVAPILLGQTGMSVTFYPSLTDAQNGIYSTSINATDPSLQYTNTLVTVQTLGVVIKNETTGCSVISTLDIRVEPLPTLIPPTSPYTICDGNQDGFTAFDLTTLTPGLLQGANYIISYHETISDANANGTTIPNPANYINIVPFVQTIYVRAEDPITHCFSVMAIVLQVNPSPIAPVALQDISVCDQDANNQNAITGIDLTIRTPDALAQQPLAGSSYTVTYYNTLASANAGTAPIIPATNYVGTNGDTIWVRVENNATGCYNLGTFHLVINIPLALVTPQPLSLCDDDNSPNDQYHSFDLTVKDAVITQGFSGYTVTYYPSYPVTAGSTPIGTPTAYTNTSPGVQTLGVEVTSAAGCKSYTSLDIRVLPIPTPNTNPPSLGTKCDDNNPGDMMEVFDLTLNAAYIQNGDPNVTLHYYNSQADALVPQNEIPPATVTAALVGDVNPAEQSVWIRVENTRVDYQGHNCYVLVEQPLTVNPLPTVVQPLAPYRVCDNDADGLAVFDLTDATVTAAILGANQLPADFTITYYLTPQGANPQTNTGETPLPNSYQNVTPNSQNIYIRVVNNATGCVNATGVLTLAVEPAAFATGPQSFSDCDNYNDPYDGIHQLDLTQYDAAILNGQNPAIFLISYYHSQADAIAGSNAIPLATAQAYTTLPDTDQIWVKVENSSNSITPVCYALTTIDITVERYPNPIITTQNNVNTICVDYASNVVVRPLLLESNIPNPADYTFEWFVDGATTPIAGATSENYLVDTASATGATRDYTVHVTSISALACDTTSLPFSVIQSGQASIPTGTTGYTVTNAFSQNQIITILVEGYGTYEYSMDDGPRQTSNVFENVSLGSHVVHVWDTEGGVAYSCDELIINDVQIIDYPHYFTPNGDGYHDYWNIVGLSNQANAKIYIFDRYGKLVKQISSQSLGWDGTYNGHLLPSDDYWFTVDYLEQATSKQFKAHFSLKR